MHIRKLVSELQPHEYLKALKIKSGLSNKEIAQNAKPAQSESNVSRIISGENENPTILSLVAVVRQLNGSLDKMYGIKEDEDESLRSLVGALRQRVEDQRENIVSLQDALARQDSIHAMRMADMKESYNERMADFRSRLEREESRCNSLQRETRRLRGINTVVIATAVLLTIVALYVVIDALNGGWGLIRY